MTELLEAGETMRRLEAEVQKARDFFGIDPAWRTPIHANLENGAEIAARPGYLEAPIRVELHFFQEKPHLIQEYMAHEVAHILSIEINRLRAVMPEEWRDKNAPAGRMFDDALEALTVRLERMYLRHVSEQPP